MNVYHIFTVNARDMLARITLDWIAASVCASFQLIAQLQSSRTAKETFRKTRNTVLTGAHSILESFTRETQG